MADANPTFDSADALRKEKKYDQALAQFEVLWQKQSGAFIGWRYAQCLRKTGQLEKAEQIARAILEKSPDDQFTKKELGWILYERELKPAREDGDLGRLVHFAHEILQLNDDPLATRLTMQSVAKVAKARGKWDIVLEWLDKVKPEDLSTEPMIIDGKRGMSDRETWYVRRASALFELGRFTEARAQAQSGLNEFPDEIFLRRTAALALANSGDVAAGASEMRALLEHRRANWYVKADLADLEYRLGNYQEAYRLMCAAISNSQDDRFKLGYFVTLAQIALKLDKPEIAADHIALAKAIRIQESWSIPNTLKAIEQETQATLSAQGKSLTDLPTDVKDLAKRCHRHWRGETNTDSGHIRGIVKSIPTDKPFTFIKRDDGGEDVFVLVRDLPRDLQAGGCVEFMLAKSFDRKKNKESVRAVNVRSIPHHEKEARNAES